MSGVIANALGPVWDRFAGLERRLRQKASVRAATVVATDPVRVRYDGDEMTDPSAPISLATVRVGDRVRVLHYGGTASLILGQVGGDRAIYGIRRGVSNMSVSGLQTYTGFGADNDYHGCTGWGTTGVVVEVGGLYRITSSVRWESASSYCQVRVLVNDNTWDLSDGPVSGTLRTQSVTSSRVMAAEDRVEMNLYAGDPMTTSVWSVAPMAVSLSVVRIGGA